MLVIVYLEYNVLIRVLVPARATRFMYEDLFNKNKNNNIINHEFTSRQMFVHIYLLRSYLGRGRWQHGVVRDLVVWRLLEFSIF